MGCCSSVEVPSNRPDIDLIIEFNTVTANSDCKEAVDQISRKYSQLSGRSIDKVEHRGITINQLLFIQDEIKARCVLEGWRDKDGNLLTPERVNLYDIKYRIIIAGTAQYKCSYVELVATGDQIPLWFVSHWWGETVFAMIKCLIRHAKDRGLSWDTPYWICVSDVMYSVIAAYKYNLITVYTLATLTLCYA